ncbi:MAG: CRTAC1 family protein [Deltaproteobacteria bacterium]|nr:CRTAC1 family protein [Deltaproteobacteria bacterium]
MSERRNARWSFALFVCAVAGGSCQRESASPAPAPAAPTALQRTALRLNQMVAEVNANQTLREVNRIEGVAEQVEREVLRPWVTAWRAGDAAGLGRLCATGAETPAWVGATRTLARSLDGTNEFRLAVASSPDDQAARYLAEFARVADFSVRANAITVEGDRARLGLRFDLRGVTPAGTRRHDRAALTLEARREGTRWRITRVGVDGPMESLESAVGRRPSFEDRTAASGLGGVPVVERREAIRRGGYAIAVNDVDGDGHNDVLVGHADSAQLWRGVGAGRFVDATAEAGIAGITLVKSAAIADFDRDGRRDLLLVRFVGSEASAALDDDDDPFKGAQGDREVLGFANRGGRFERVQQVLQRGHRYDRAMPLSVADFDANGTLDLYLGFPGVRDFTNNLARTGGREGFTRQGLWRNNGNWNFVEMSMGSELQGSNDMFPHASLATDLDGDGRPDLVVIDDSGRPNLVYRNDGTTLHESSAAMHIDMPGWGMGVASGDFDGDGDLDLAMTNITLHAADRILQTMRGLPASPEFERVLEEDGASNRGLRLFRNNGRGDFTEATVDAGLSWAGESPAGAEWIDYNHDGRLDLYVANGLWTGSADGDDLSSLFFRLAIARRLSEDAHPDSAMSGPSETVDPNPMLTVLREFRGRLGAPGTGVVGGPTLSFSGSEHHRLFRNNGDGTFTDVSFIEGADRTEDGYVIAPADLDGDGVEDLVLRNCDPAPGQNFPVVVYLHNTRTADHALHVALRGVTDNLDGVGARIIVRVGDRTLVREVRGANGAAQGEHVATFGLGDARAVESVEVRWPSGDVQRLGPANEGRLVVTQGRAPAP